MTSKMSDVVDIQQILTNELTLLAIHAISSSNPHCEQIAFLTLGASTELLKTTGISPRWPSTP